MIFSNPAPPGSYILKCSNGAPRPVVQNGVLGCVQVCEAHDGHSLFSLKMVSCVGSVVAVVGSRSALFADLGFDLVGRGDGAGVLGSLQSFLEFSNAMPTGLGDLLFC